MRKITSIIIHCSNTPNGDYVSVDNIDLWHQHFGLKRDPELIGYNQPKLKHIGFHFFVNAEGATTIGRGLKEEHGFWGSYFHQSIGICLAGSSKFSVNQWLTLKHLVTTMRRDFAAVYQVKGKPGFNVRQWLDGGSKPLATHLLD